MQLTVARNRDGVNGLVPVDINEIIFLEYIGGSEAQIIVHKLHEVYYIMGTLTFWVNALHDSGYDFVRVDRNNALNIRNIKRLDDRFKKAYFEEELRSDSKSCTLAWEKYKAIVKRLKALNQPVIIEK